MASTQHLAAIIPRKGGPLAVISRPTPSPGPEEVLIEVKSIAVNPIDYYQRDFGFPPLAGYPSIIGSDIAGTVLAVGSSVSPSTPMPGSRVLAFAPAFSAQGAPDYGGLQKKVLVPTENVTPIPDSLSFNEASVMPMAVITTWGGWFVNELGREPVKERQGFLVWGAASSVGSAVVQIAKLMGYTVYATASGKHHDYIKSLGASRVFDYKSEGVVESITQVVREDGITMRTGYDAVGALQESLDVLKAVKPEGVIARLATAASLREGSPKVEGVEAKFVVAPPEEEKRKEHFQFVFTVWLKDMLEKGKFVPSPHIKVVEGGLESANKALDELRGGVSGTKLVLEV